MSWLEQYRALARYNLWMNGRLYGLVGKLGEEERKRDRGAFFQSIHGTLNHILLGDRIWLGRFTGDRERYTSKSALGESIVVTSLGQQLYAEFPDLARERAQTDADIVAYCHQVDEPALLGALSYQRTDGVPQTGPLWWALGHFFNHQTHHRGQVTTLLMQAGVDPGVTDLVAMLRAEPSEED